MEPGEKARSVHQLKELLDALKNSVPRPSWDAPQLEMNYMELSDMHTDAPVLPSMSPLVSSKSAQQPKPKPVKKRKITVKKPKKEGKPKMPPR